MWRGIGFVIEHRKGIGHVTDFTPFIKSIEWIEERTGLNFFPSLSTPDKTRIEHTSSPLF